MSQTAKSVFCIVLALCVLSSVDGASVRDVTGRKSDDWDILILTQSWPPAECIFFRSQCQIPAGIKGWGIHGLWPTKNNTFGPNYCNDEWEFNISKIQSLVPAMHVNWPSIDAGESSEHVWCHEWDKHGTCGSTLPALKDQLHYFNVTLGLHQRFNLSTILQSGSIVPSESQSYSYTQVRNAVQKKTGSLPSLSCIEDKNDGKCYLEQMELCMTKAFQPVDCVSHSSLQRRQTLLFQSEKDKCLLRSSGLRSSSSNCCQEGEIYYKPMPSL